MQSETIDISSPPPARKAAWRGWMYIGVVVAAAVTSTVIVGRNVPSLHASPLIPWEVMALAFFVAFAAPVNFHTGRQSIIADMSGLVVLVGGVASGTAGLLLAAGIAVLFSGFLLGRQVKKTVFNVASTLTTVALSLFVLHLLVAGSSPASPRAWPALLLVLLTQELLSAGLTLGAVIVVEGSPGWGFLRSYSMSFALVLPINAALGIGAATVAWFEPWALLPLAGPVVLLALWYRRAEKIRNRHADLQKLYGFTVKLAEQTDSRDLVWTALLESRQLLHCHFVAVYLPGTDGVVRHYLDATSNLRSDRSAPPHGLRRVVEQEQSILLARGRTSDLASELGVSDLVAAPIEIDGGGRGVLLIGDREGSLATFDSEDRSLLEALAANLGTALTSSRRQEELRTATMRRDHEARHDVLTGLPNRSEFSSQLSETLAARNPSEMTGVILMDLDGFKEINDTLGHDIGDTVLQRTAERFRAVAGGSLVARLGGDEFAVLIASARSIDEVITVAEAARDAVSQSIFEQGLMLDVRASVGVAVTPLHGSDPLKCAEVAMYEAKRAHGGIITYDPAIDHNTTRKLLLATELRRAMSAEELEVFYQPVAEATSGEVIGFEALLRWHHHQYGSVSPVEFIPVAEKTGLIGELTWWVLGKALGELRRWNREGYDVSMAVNMSTRTLLDSGLVGRLRELIENTGVRPRSVALEITESSIMIEPERSERVLHELADLGVSIAIDDYGTEYSSLSRLQRLPVSTVKIDRSFVMHMSADAKDEAIVRTTIDLAHNMGHEVIAEGVEDLTTWERLKELGCDHIQGYYLSPPIPAEQCHLWLRNRQAAKLAPVRHLRSLSQGA